MTRKEAKEIVKNCGDTIDDLESEEMWECFKAIFGRYPSPKEGENGSFVFSSLCLALSIK